MAVEGTQSGIFGRRNWLAWTAGIVVAIVLLAAFMSRGEVVPVQAATVQRSTIRSVVSTNGKVEPLRNFEAHAPMGTTVRELLVKEGAHVKKAQLLLRLEDADARSQLARAQAQIQASQADLSAIESGGNREEVLSLQAELVKARTERDAAGRNLKALRRLREEGAASPAEVNDAQGQFERADAELKMLQQKQRQRYSPPEIARTESQKNEARASYAAAQETVRQLNVRAPFDGEVYSLPVHQGAYVNAGDLVLEEADLSHVLVRAFVDEPDIGHLAPGQRIEVNWDALPGRVWPGTVSTVPSNVKLRGTRNVGETTFVIDNHDFKLLPNVNVSVTIVTGEHADVLSVPREAVRQDDIATYVYQIVNDALQRREIKTSISNLTQVEVTSGIAQGAQVALASTNSKPLHEGLAVKVVH